MQKEEKPTGKPTKGFKTFATLLPYLRKHTLMIVGGTLILLVSSCLRVFIPRLIRVAIDLILATTDNILALTASILPGSLGPAWASSIESLVTQKGTVGLVTVIVAALLGVGLLIGLSQYLGRRWLAGSAMRVIADLRKGLLEHLQKLSFTFFNTHQVGDLMAHATNDLNAIRRAMMPGYVIMVAVSFMVVLSFLSMATLRWPLSGILTVYAVGPLLLMSVLSLYFGRILHKRFRAVRDTFSAMSAKVSENISGIRVVKAYVQEKGEVKHFDQISTTYVDQHISLVKAWGLFFPLIMFLANLSMLIILLLGGRLVIIFQMTVGDFIAFQTYLWMLVWPMIAIGWIINLLESGTASMARINKLLRTQPEIADSPYTFPITAIKGHVQFHDVSFSYPDIEHSAVQGISFDLPPGKILGITGTVGSGKSTLASLIPRLYEPTAGKITIDSTPIHLIPLSVLRSSIGMVPQDCFLFSQTVKENVAFGTHREAGQSEIENAAKIAGIHAEIVRFPEGYDNVLGELGVTVSGGQKQRLTTARAIIRNPSILILDDALSSVDADTEIEILTSLKEIMSSRAVIIVSARPRALSFADEILVLDHGFAVERGTHRELIKQDGLYTLFAKLQGIA